jgi:DNA-directed RNA polymerase subunit RPC12/RpoP
MHEKLKIICPIHGEFSQKAQGHLIGKGCRKCKYDKHKILTRSNIQEFSKKAKRIHNDNYNYSNSNYINSNTKIYILCNRCKKIFNQTPHDHLDGHGCPYCPHHISKPEILFLNFLKITQRQNYICGYKVDGIKGNKIFEFLGNYYHGNPKIYKSKEYNQICHKTFGELYKITKRKLTLLKNEGYKVYYIWEKDWNDWNNGIIKTFPIKLVSQPMTTY